jgi:hypothetical protein
MAHFEDLTKYSYSVKFPTDELNIGWLQTKEFPKGDIPNKEKFCEKLFEYYKNPVRQMKGFQRCLYCKEISGKYLRDNPQSSSNEIRVVGKDGKVYASPAMIIHYIKEHDYLPPQEFIEAVLHGPKVNSEEYNNACEKSLENMIKQHKEWLESKPKIDYTKIGNNIQESIIHEKKIMDYKTFFS